MKVTVELSSDVDNHWTPDEDDCGNWVRHTLETIDFPTAASVSLRFVHPEESATLNATYRHKEGPTNVLSFPVDIPQPVAEAMGYRALGDIVICPELVDSEAATQHKTLPAHWAHLVIHGTLHLLGHDHQDPETAASMEALEINTLERLGFPNPYLIG